MNPKLPPRDPGSAYVRRKRAERRVGMGAKCACGESKPLALVPGSNPTLCAECDRKKKGKTTVDNHHPAGKANDPTTVPIPVNDHRAELSEAQADWPPGTLENSDGDPLLACAARIRGFVDTVVYLIKKLLLPVADALEWLQNFLLEKLGPKWWVGTPMEGQAPKR